MDKRTLLTRKVFTMDDGYSLRVNVFLKKGKKGRLARTEYGELCIYTNGILSEEKLLSFVKKVYQLRKKQITQRPFTALERSAISQEMQKGKEEKDTTTFQKQLKILSHGTKKTFCPT